MTSSLKQKGNIHLFFRIFFAFRESTFLMVFNEAKDPLHPIQLKSKHKLVGML